MRWKAHFFLNGDGNTKSSKYGLPTKNSAPIVPEMKAFEEDLVDLISNIKFKNINDDFLENIENDMKKVGSYLITY